MISILRHIWHIISSFFSMLWTLIQFLVKVVFKGTLEHTSLITDAVSNLLEAIEAIPVGISTFAVATIVVSVIMLIFNKRRTN